MESGIAYNISMTTPPDMTIQIEQVEISFLAKALAYKKHSIPFHRF